MSRSKLTFLNAKVNILFQLLLLFTALFSRKIILHFLGNDLVGLNATIQNVFGIMNLAELGIWPATAYALYSYIHNDNKEKIKEVITLFGYFYKIIGFLILGVGLVTAFFLPIIFKNTTLDYLFVIASFFTFLLNVLLGYFFNYKQILLVADQKNYILIIISSLIQLTKVFFQIGFLYFLNGNFLVWLLLECIFGILNTIFLNIYVIKFYPWLKLPKYNKYLLVEHSSILKNIKRLASQKFAAVILSQSDNILIFSFSSLGQVTFFSNYTLIINKIIVFLNTSFNSGAASIGNLIATKDEQKIEKVFYEILVLRYLISGVIVICLFQLLNPFINIWLGREYILDSKLVALIILNAYISITRNSIDNFIDGYGLYGNVWASWTEAVLNLTISLIFGYRYGIIGVLWGTFISTFLIVCLWKPYYLFRSGFKNACLFNYWFTIIRNIVILFFVHWVLHLIGIYKNNSIVSYTSWILFALKLSLISFLLYLVILYLTSPSIRSLASRFYKIFIKKTFNLA